MSPDMNFNSHESKNSVIGQYWNQCILYVNIDWPHGGMRALASLGDTYLWKVDLKSYFRKNVRKIIISLTDFFFRTFSLKNYLFGKNFMEVVYVTFIIF